MFELTHAGGVVVRTEEGSARYLLVSAKGNPDRWVLPKGHIEPGETPETAAVREVSEEGGVAADILESLGSVQFEKNGLFARVEFFLMRYVGERAFGEDRKRRWCAYEEAIELLAPDYARDLLRRSRSVTVRHFQNPEPTSR